MAGTPWVRAIAGEGAPSEAPAYPGQPYLDTTTGALWVGSQGGQWVGGVAVPAPTVEDVAEGRVLSAAMAWIDRLPASLDDWP